MPGENDVSESVVEASGTDGLTQTVTLRSINAYHDHFGADYYGFWYQGTRCLILNTTLLSLSLSPSCGRVSSVNSVNLGVTSEAGNENDGLIQAKVAHEDWLNEELAQAKLSAQNVFIFSYHDWSTPEQAFLRKSDINRLIPEEVREKWLPKMRHDKVRFLFTSCCHTTVTDVLVQRQWKSFAKTKTAEKDTIKEKGMKTSDDDEDDSHSDKEDDEDEVT